MGFVGPNNPFAKGPVTYCLDEISKDANAAALMKTLRDEIAALEGQNYRGLVDVFSKHLIEHVIEDSDKVEKIVNYLRQYWFDDTSETIEFKTAQPIAPAYAQGVVKALDLAMEHGRSIDSWWIVDAPEFSFFNLVSDKQVTALILTPRPKTIAPSGIWSTEIESESGGWVTTSGDGGAPATRQVGNRPAA